ncbi:MAG TPA: pyridoxamine 5'-phosphate oxidase family protein [Polyangiaceae bacterium]|nr:pyridoxamine 5'-phosphate oxidase family protein [Polyangiaceae bacterium]
MPARFLSELFTPEVTRAQERYTRRSWALPSGAPPDRLGPDEAAFIAERDSFYLASISSSGWPYVQHRGGPPGFVRATDDHTLAFADFRGNKQLITTGNVLADERVALILVDYPTRTRLKVLGRAHVEDARSDAALVARFAPEEVRKKVERVVTIDVVGFDWNCPQFITPRYTVPEIEELVEPLRQRIRDLETELGRRSAR